MEQNDSRIPSLALLGALILYGGAFSESLPAGAGRAELSVIQIALMTFATALLIYGAIGWSSVWLEGKTLEPRRRMPQPGVGAVAACLCLSVLLALASGLFVRTIRQEQAGGAIRSAREGVIAGALFLLIALILAVYRRAFISDEVVVEGPENEAQR